MAASQLKGKDSGAKTRSLQVLGATAAACALQLIFGHIPLKVMGWVIMGPTAVSLVSCAVAGAFQGQDHIAY